MSSNSPKPPHVPTPKTQASVSVHINGDGCWPDIKDRPDDLTWLQGTVENLSIARLQSGMASGASSVAIRVNTPDGRVVVVELSMKLFQLVAQAFAAADQSAAFVPEQSRGKGH